MLIDINNWTVEYDYHPVQRQGLETEPLDEGVEIHSVKVGTKEIIGIIDLETLENKVLWEIKRT